MKKPGLRFRNPGQIVEAGIAPANFDDFVSYF
jgi:hypothetical protein